MWFQPCVLCVNRTSRAYSQAGNRVTAKTMQRLAAAVWALGIALESVSLGAQRPLDSAQGQPIFRSRVDLVTVDATVTGPDGRAVDGLAAGDFALKVDGETRRVVSAQYVAFDRPEFHSNL